MLIPGIAHEEISLLLPKPSSFLFLSMGCNAAADPGKSMGTKNQQGHAGSGCPVAGGFFQTCPNPSALAAQ
jgi:hypothetical protein